MAARRKWLNIGANSANDTRRGAFTPFPFLKIQTEKTMSYKSLMAAAASAAIVIATPALAQGKGGGAGGPPAGAGAGASAAGSVSQGPMSASPNGIMNASPNSVLSTGATTPPTTSTTTTTRAPQTTTRTPETDTDTDSDTTGTTSRTGTSFSTKSKALQNSQGPAHASPNGIAHASPNSVLARGAVQSSTLPGLTTGLVVNNSSGTQVGTVSRVITGPNNTIRAVVVKTSSGQLVTLPPSSLTISGSVVTTTSTSIGG